MEDMKCILIDLGFLDYVENRRKYGSKSQFLIFFRFFDELEIMQMRYLNEISLKTLHTAFSKPEFPELAGLLKKYGKTEADANS